jgi:hypothetical protein
MAFRTVTGQFFKAGTMPWADAEVWFTLQKGSYSVEAHYPADSLKVRTDVNGRISVDLWISEEAQSTTNWLCRQPSGETFKFGVPAGVGSIALEDLRAIGSPPVVPTPNLSALIDSRIAAHNADAAAHPGLGGGGPGAVTLLVTQTDLVGSKAVLLHSLGTIGVDVQVLDVDGSILLAWKPLGGNYIEVDFEGLIPLTQAYTVIIEGY